MFRIRRNIYLDNNATTVVSDRVRKKINYVLKNVYGNPSSLYKVARKSATILEESREQVAKIINAKPNEIIFTGSASEANNSILISVSEHFYPKKKKIISSPIEHASVINTLEYLKTKGFTVAYCPVDKYGKVILSALEKMIDENTILICCMLANNEIGTMQDIKTISQMVSKHDVLLMVDCVQALGKIKVDINELEIDYASFSAHKIHGPKGVGALYIKDGRPFTSYIHGGHQEQGLRAGTEGLHNIAGFAETCREEEKLLDKSVITQSLKNYFIEQIKKIKPDCVINSPIEECLPNTVSISFPGYENSLIMAMLDHNGISVSAGSACNTHENTPSHVLSAIGLSDQESRQTIRISLSTYVKKSGIDYLLKVLDLYFSGKQTPINVVAPKQVNEDFLFATDLFIIDIRFWYDRKILSSLPNSHEASFLKFPKYVKKIPKDKNILLVCQGGYNSPIVAYYLRSKGYKNVSILMTGLIGWKIANNELYQKYAGKNITKL